MENTEWKSLLARLDRLKAAGYSESEVARRAGGSLSPSTINRWRAGRFGGRQDSIAAVMRAVDEIEAELGLAGASKEERLLALIREIYTDEGAATVSSVARMAPKRGPSAAPEGAEPERAPDPAVKPRARRRPPR